MKKELNFLRKIYRIKDINAVELKLVKAGRSKTEAITYLNLRYLTTIIVFLACLYIYKIGYIVAPIFAVIYYYMYEYILLVNPIKKRVSKLDREALTFFEIMTLGLESGKNLESAITVACENVDSEISKDFQKALAEMKYGKSLLEVLEDMKERMPSEAINNIVLSIIESNVFGNSILETMYNQIDFLRDKQILEIKEQINKIPNKISILSVIFVIPLILMLILGPFLINFLGWKRKKVN